MSFYCQCPIISPILHVLFHLTLKFINNQQFRINNEPTTYTFDQQFQRPYGVFSFARNYSIKLGSEYRVEWTPAAGVSSIYARAVKVQPKTPGTGILTVSLQATNPQLAADIVNYLMVEYDSFTVEQNNYSNDQMLRFIDERLTYP